MSMDELERLMKIFEIELEQFNLEIKESFKSLNESHDWVSPLWQDSMRSTYDAQWIELEDQMNTYVNRTGQSYVETLLRKLHALGGYLRGR